MPLSFQLIILVSLATAIKLLYLCNSFLFQPLSIVAQHIYHHHNEKKLTKSISLKLRGLNYTPRKGPASDIQNECKSINEIRSDLRILTQVTDTFHLYALSECSQAAVILPMAREMGFNAFLNIWVDGSKPFNNPNGSFATEMHEFEYLLENNMIRNYNESGGVMAISVGSESYHRHEVTIDENIAYMDIVQTKLHEYNITGIPLTITDIDKTFMMYPHLMSAVDFASINAFPFFDIAYGKKKANRAIAYLNGKILEPLLAEANKIGKSLFLTETGWPEAGTDCSNSGIPCSEASVANQLRYFVDFYCEIHLKKPQLQYFWFDALDSTWRREQDVGQNSVEGHFGIFDDDCVMKDHFQSLSFTCSDVVGYEGIQFTMPNITYPKERNDSK